MQLKKNQSGLSKKMDLSCIFLLMLTSVYSVVAIFYY